MRKRFPSAHKVYRAAYERGDVKIGHVLPVAMPGQRPSWIIHFPTKEHWHHPSQLPWIEEGLRSLRTFVDEHRIGSIAIPALGCGLGKLDWERVRPLIVEAFADASDVRVELYGPNAGATHR